MAGRGNSNGRRLSSRPFAPHPRRNVTPSNMAGLPQRRSPMSSSKKSRGHIKRNKSARFRARLKAKHRRARKRQTNGERKFYR
jgi:hypothetical protein